MPVNRYIRQQQLPEIGTSGQKKIRECSVAMIGCGALGSIASMYLAGAGTGRLVIADFDTIDITNLHRQLSYKESDTGQSKSATLRTRLLEMNSDIEVEAIEAFIRPDRMREIAASVDVVVEAGDNPDTKYMVSDVCAALGKPCVIGGVSGWEGQVMTQIPGSLTYRDLFPSADTAGFTPCSIGGVMGPVPGIVGSMQAIETLKIITDAGKTLAGRLLVIDTLHANIQTIELQ